LRDIVDPANDELIDHALVLWFPAPHSFTGEDVVELHLHGGRAIIRATLEALTRLDGFALAQAGEFSRRAFDNGKMDLTEAEGIADLVDAETAAQRRQALRQMDGALGRLYHGWAESLTQSLAYIEAEIDFADEDIPADLTQGRLAAVRAVLAEMEGHLADNHRGERLREGFTVALLGAPNAGKSSLLNALAQREAAIVSPIAGTTRDVIEVDLDLGGCPVCVIDTAGLRESADEIESEGVRRALARAQQADLKLLLFDGSVAQPFDEATMALADKDALVVVNKADVRRIQDSGFGIQGRLPSFSSPCPPSPLRHPRESGDPVFLNGEKENQKTSIEKKRPLLISAKTGEGMVLLLASLVQEIEGRFMASESPPLTRLRHREAVEACAALLRRALVARETELCAEDLRVAVRALGRITGRVDVEDLLDIIFSSFCVGK
jgi:tRNA modification GTPase